MLAFFVLVALALLIARPVSTTVLVFFLAVGFVGWTAVNLARSRRNAARRRVVAVGPRSSAEGGVERDDRPRPVSVWLTMSIEPDPNQLTVGQLIEWMKRNPTANLVFRFDPYKVVTCEPHRAVYRSYDATSDGEGERWFVRLCDDVPVSPKWVFLAATSYPDALMTPPDSMRILTERLNLKEAYRALSDDACKTRIVTRHVYDPEAEQIMKTDQRLSSYVGRV